MSMSSHGMCPDCRRGTPHQRLRLEVWAPLILAALLASFWLIACGQVSAGGQYAAGGKNARGGTLAHATSTQSRLRPGAMALTSCSTEASPPIDAGAFKPDVIVSQGGHGGGSPQTVVLAKGQRLEIRLVSTLRWQLTETDAAHILAGTTPEGWYDRAQSACIWRFTAVATGSAKLSYSGVADCPPREVCPAVEQALTYAVTVQ